MRLRNIIQNVADGALTDQTESGSFPAGRNGPYNDSETPTRNTSHWVIVFLSLYEWTGHDRYREAAERGIDYLLSEQARPSAGTFFHRDCEDKDASNGVIGQAWTIEALVKGADVLARPKLEDIASKVFLLHPFEEKLGLWKQVSLTGSIRSFDATFNHQLWFAASGGLITQLKEGETVIDRQVTTFLDRLDETISITPSGLIYHRSLPDFTPSKFVALARNDLMLTALCSLEWTGLTGNSVLQRYLNSRFSPVRRAPLSGETHVHKSIGYHAFNLYALALLNQSYPDHEFWSSETMNRILSYVEDPAYIQGLEDNEFGYPYNPPGIEVSYALQTFRGDTSRQQQKEWLARQFSRTFNPETNRLERNTPDPETLTARLYEATRLPNLDVDLDSTLQAGGSAPE